MIAKMKKVALVGERENLKKVIDTLKASGNFQITFYKANGNDLSPTDANTKTELTRQLNRVTNAINYVNLDRKPLAMSYQDLQGITKKQKQIEKLLAQIEQNKAVTNNLSQQIINNQNQIAGLTPFRDLPINANLLKNTRHVFVLAGLMSGRNFQRFQNDLGTNDFLCETYPTGKNQMLVVLTGDLENLPIARTVENYDWLPFSAPDFNRTPQAQIDLLTKQNQDLTARLTEQKNRNQLTAEQSALLKTYHDYLTNELDTLDILNAVIQTKSCFIVHGWLPAKDVPQFTQLIRQTNRHVVVDIKEAVETDTPPAMVHNSPLVAPYQAITAMYGAPARTDLDPNPWVAIFYFLFFGMMFGDVAYGLLLSVITALILIIAKPRGGTKQLLAIFCFGGISAGAWGLVFNSCFGLNLPSFIMPQTIIDPLGHDAILFFALSLYLGVIQLAFGTLLNVINHLRQKQWLTALLQALPHTVLFVGLTLSFPTLISQIITLDYPFIAWFQPLMLPGVILIVVGFAGMVLFNGLGKKLGGYLVSMFSGAYKVVSYFSDILSYARLFGVGLVGCVIAYVANYLFGMFAGLGFIGIILGGLVAIIFHALNIALGLLSTYIHNARLQFVEFFGKFYAGTGSPFTPMGSQLRYTRILGNAEYINQKLKRRSN